MNFDERVIYMRGMINRAHKSQRGTVCVNLVDLAYLLDYYDGNAPRRKPAADSNPMAVDGLLPIPATSTLAADPDLPVLPPLTAELINLPPLPAPGGLPPLPELPL